jgi:DHA1 family tetracycline resistance protein-like MFS transporter
MGAAFGLGFVIGPAVGGLLGELGPRVPFYVAAVVSLLNFVYGWFVLPEIPAAGNAVGRSIWRGPIRLVPSGCSAPIRACCRLCAVLAVFFFATSVYPAIWPFWGIARFGWSEAMVG